MLTLRAGYKTAILGALKAGDFFLTANGHIFLLASTPVGTDKALERRAVHVETGAVHFLDVNQRVTPLKKEHTPC